MVLADDRKLMAVAGPRDARDGPVLKSASFRIVPLVIASALFMENMDSTVISTSLPAMAVDLHIDPVILKFAFTSYLLSLSVFIPVSGWCADRFGARTIFRSAIGVFLLGSIACGFATSLFWLVLARALQGVGGAMMVPVGRLVMVRSVPKGELVNAMAYLTLPALLGPVVGPPLGGFITTYFHWRWIFWINVPIGCVGLVLSSLFIPNIRENDPGRLDVRGFILSGTGLSSLIFGLTLVGQSLVPLPVTIAAVFVGIVCIGLYVRHAKRVESPIIDLRLLAFPTFRANIFGGFLFRVGIGATPFLLPLMLQAGFGKTAFQSGNLTFMTAAGALVMKATAGPILKRLGFRKVLVWNGLISAMLLAGCALFTAKTPAALMMVVLLTGGFFRSLQFTSLNTIAYAELSSPQMSPATSFVSMVQQFSMSMGVVIGAFALETAQALRGDHSLLPPDFSAAFIVVALISAASVFVNRRLSDNAGEELSGHRQAA